MRLRMCMAGCFFAAPVCDSKWLLGRLRGYPRRVGVASKWPRSNQKKRKGRTADDVGIAEGRWEVHFLRTSAKSGLSDAPPPPDIGDTTLRRAKWRSVYSERARA